jgi:S1-C subfamily serine protease
MLITLALQTMLVAVPAPRDREPPDKGPGFVGVTFQASDDGGVMITEIRPDGPAEKAGMRVHDVIRKFNGEPISFEAFPLKIIRIRPGTIVPIEVQRDADTVMIKLKIGLRPEDYPFPLPTSPMNVVPGDVPPPPK